MRTRGRYGGRAAEAVAVGGLPRLNDMATAGVKGAGKGQRETESQGRTRRRCAAWCRRRWSRPGAMSSSAASWRIQSRSQQLATSAAAEEDHRVCGLSNHQRNSGDVPGERSIEAILAINWLHGMDHRPWPVHSSNRGSANIRASF